MKTTLTLLLSLAIQVHAADLNASGQTREEWDQAWTGRGYSFQEWDDLWVQSYQSVRQKKKESAARYGYPTAALALGYLIRRLLKRKQGFSAGQRNP